jgi:hypothetical protein
MGSVPIRQCRAVYNLGNVQLGGSVQLVTCEKIKYTKDWLTANPFRFIGVERTWSRHYLKIILLIMASVLSFKIYRVQLVTCL